MMQAFAYRHLVPAQELDVAVARRNPARAVMRVLGPMPIKIPAGKTASIRVGVPAAVPAGDFQLELDQPPEGISIQSVNALPMTTEVVLKADSAKVKPGQAGNLIVNVFLIPKPPASAPASAAKPATPAPAARPGGNQRRVPLGSLPAIAYEISNP